MRIEFITHVVTKTSKYSTSIISFGGLVDKCYIKWTMIRLDEFLETLKKVNVR